LHRSHIRALATRASAAASSFSSFDQGWEGSRRKAALALGLSLTAAVLAVTGVGASTSPAQAEAAAAAAAAGKEYTKAEVQAHKTKERGMWGTYQGGVYDIPQFGENPQGGEGGREGGREGTGKLCGSINSVC